ncbi:MAG: type IV pilus twitching motility protein PilT [Deltaproteobacteria bacterium]|nr:type IV pilus twitching motility protein PilT [Deltaproteobacteria bacterium]
MVELNDVLKIAIQTGASDVHFKVGLPPMFRVDGDLLPLKEAARLSPDDVAAIAGAMMNESQQQRFNETREMDLAYSVSGLGRFRVNVFQQRGTIGLALRVIPNRVRSIDELMLPKVIEKLALEPRGLILVTGVTGSGKSTTLAGMIDAINQRRACHIMTIEDPIEYLIRDKRSVINQREIGIDTATFAHALRSALRQDPDVILVGEMRDPETIETALNAAETGHLVMSTLHTLDATETINRIVAAFPPHQQKQVRLQVSSVLKAVISQRLVVRQDGRGRVPALEILVNTSYVRELIEDKERTKEIGEAIAKGQSSYGMQTFDQSLMALYSAGYISYDEALRQASNPADFALRVSGIANTSDARWENVAPPQAAPAAAATPAPRARQTGAAPPAAAPSGAKQKSAATEGEDDMQIERFGR